jgi:peroxiredoxin
MPAAWCVRLVRLVCVVGLLCGTTALGVQPGWQLSLQGTVAPLGEDRLPGEVQKRFDVQVLIAAVDADGTAHCYWHADESGRGRWPWPQRFGQATIDRDGKISGHEPALLYDYGGGTSVIPLVLPVFPRAGLAVGQKWETDRWHYAVQRAEAVGQRPAWRVVLSNAYGPQRTLWIAQDTPVVLRVQQRHFMDMGREHHVQWQLTAQVELSEAERAAAVASYRALLETRARLDVAPRDPKAQWSAAQRAVLQEAMPRLEEQVTLTALLRLVQAARRDLGVQTALAGAIERLTREQTGREVPDFALGKLEGGKFSRDDLQGKLTLLHFWDYRDAPLEEPYGQVGYLDFLHRKRTSQGLAVYGVAVNAALRDEQARSGVVRGARRLASFMNLSYPLLLDDGEALQQFGDPRELGASLPLYVLIGRDGRVLHYHVGYYEVDRNEGLKALDAAVAKALEP